MSKQTNDSSENGHRNGNMTKLTLGALGVVFGDIGTSPLYALRECFHGAHAHLDVTKSNILGVLSLIFWSLIIVISLKYLLYVMRADNRGEGGVLALMALACPRRSITSREPRFILIILGLFGAALLYGDGVITPAISVLSAVEGLNVATTAFEHYVLPITVVILILLFMVQKRGTDKIGTIFGPVILVWFTTMGVFGLLGIFKHASVLYAIAPWHAVNFFIENRVAGFLTLGSVFLVVTGGEALYADMGHFGLAPIKRGWFMVVMPCLMLNYFGQGAILLENPEVASNPFYHLAPRWALYPTVVLATMATVIASQAVISGAFSLTLQAVQLGYLPRLEINHTSHEEKGQIYVPYVNWALLAATIWLVLNFQSSTRLAAAYGIAVTGTMFITTILVFFVAKEKWGWSLPWLIVMTIGLLIVDFGFFGANIVKLPDGGWFPLTLGLAILILMMTWRRGREILGERLRERWVPLKSFMEQLEIEKPIRVPGAAVFMTGNVTNTPNALVHNVRHNHVLHSRIVLLQVLTQEIPHVPPSERIEIEELGSGFFQFTLNYGFMDTPDVPKALAEIGDPTLKCNLADTTYFLGRETLIPTSRRKGMAVWRENLFAFMSRNAQQATAFFHIPPDQVVEIGIHIEL